ncbi:MAG: allantoicase [Bacteriovoracaceae bacterium]|jgi:allantoicase|nr:allantoicase [Bacteriovoracaceae bacterium]
METIIRPDSYDSSFSDKWINLAEERLGTEILYVTDDFFAEVGNLIKPGRGIFIENKYTKNGKWMDGWESRRKRTEGHDYCVLKLGLPGVIKGFDVDTNFFTGNHPNSVSVEACKTEKVSSDTEWIQILPDTKMNPGSQHLVEISNQEVWTHLKLNIYPDGGVARLRVFGEVKKDWLTIKKGHEIDLAAVENEGKALICSDMYFSHKDNINAPGRGRNMGDGWETKRRRGPGHDWLILSLGKKGILNKLEVDTAHFKGNFPDSCSVEGLLCSTSNSDFESKENEWKPVLNKEKLSSDHIHFFEELLSNGPYTHIRLNMYPDGGISRFRVWGNICD